jgi:hypothetical protein
MSNVQKVYITFFNLRTGTKAVIFITHHSLLIINFLPRTHPKTHPATLAKIYKKARIYLPFSKSVVVWREKAEKVVKPPQSPVWRKAFALSLAFSPKNSPENSPIRNDPTIFIPNVTSGKSELTGINPTKYLKTAPQAPPKPTRITNIFSPK